MSYNPHEADPYQAYANETKYADSRATAQQIHFSQYYARAPAKREAKDRWAVN